MTSLHEGNLTNHSIATQADIRRLTTTRQYVACRMLETGWPRATYWPPFRYRTARNRSADCLVYRINDFFELWLGEDGMLYSRVPLRWGRHIFTPWPGETAWPSAALVRTIIADLDSVEREHCAPR